MRDESNIKEVASLRPDFIGFIFYPPSPRYAAGLKPDIVTSLPKSITPVAVLVDPELNDILELNAKYGFKTFQLHGQETPEFCKELKSHGFEVIKAFRVSSDNKEDIKGMLPKYKGKADLLLFDTAGTAPGGNGYKFDWNILEEIKSGTPFLLSGGIEEKDASGLKDFLPAGCLGVDLNSRFEIEPGLKDTRSLTNFINEFKYEQAY